MLSDNLFLNPWSQFFIAKLTNDEPLEQSFAKRLSNCMTRVRIIANQAMEEE